MEWKQNLTGAGEAKSYSVENIENYECGYLLLFVVVFFKEKLFRNQATHKSKLAATFVLSPPFSNVVVEMIFSAVKIIKTEQA